MSGETSDLLKENKLSQSNANESSSISGTAMFAPPAYSVTNDTVQRKPDDHAEELFAGDDRIDTASGIKDVYNPVFDASRMRDELKETTFQGMDSKELREAMVALQGTRTSEGDILYPQGEELQTHLAAIAQVRNLDIEKVQSDYQRMQEIKAAGEKHGKENKHDDVSPLLDTTKHPEFMGSQSQLRFGMTMGDVFGVDPVFGALISPTGGAVGPGNDSVSDAPINNATVLHGTVHDAAGYLKNAHGIGPGYNYLKEDWEIATEEPLSGQMSGIPYWLDAAPDQVNLATFSTARRMVKESKEAGGDLSFSDAMLHASIEVSEKNQEFDDYSWASGDKISKGMAATADVGLAAARGWNSVKGLAGDAWDWTKEKGGQIKQGASDAWDWTKEKAGQGLDKVKGMGSDAWDWMKEKGGQAKDAAGGAWDWAKDKAGKGINKAKGLGSDAWDWAKEKGGQAKDGVSDAIGWGKDQASSAWGGMKDMASSAWGSVTDTWERIQQDRQQYEHGSKPVGDGVSGPWGYAGRSQDENGDPLRGYEGGFGGFGDRIGNSYTEFLYGNGNIGEYNDPNGGQRYGVEGHAGVARGSVDFVEMINGLAPGTIDPGVIASLDLGAGTANANAWVNPESGFDLSAGASAAEIALNMGTTGTGDRDSQARIGWGLGPAAGLRGHWGDSDGDKIPEYGFGFDLPVGLSVDVKSEDPLRDYGVNGLLGAIPGGAMAMPWVDSMLGESNLTVRAGNAASEAWDTTSEAASSAWGSLSEGASSLWDSATGAAGNAVDYGRERASEAWSGAKNMGNRAVNGAKSLGSKAVNGAKNLGSKAQGLAGDAWSGAKNMGNKAVSGAKSLGNKAIGGAKSLGNKAQGLASDAWSGAKNVGSKAASGARKAASSAWSGAKSVGSKAASGAKKAASSAWSGAKSAGSSAKKAVSNGWDSFKSLF